MLELSNIGIFTAFAAGIISFISPCVLPLVPAYVSYISGQSVPDRGTAATIASRLSAVGLSSSFVLGFSTVFILLGASATLLGRMLLAYRYELNIIGGGIVILFGLLMLGVFRMAWLQRDMRFHLDLPGGRVVAAYVLGLAFAFGWTPCIGPILGAILTVNAATASVSEGVTLLAIYSAGLGVPFLATAIFAEKATRRLKAVGKAGHYFQKAAGGVMIVMGVAMITGSLSRFSYWLLDSFPILGTIG